MRVIVKVVSSTCPHPRRTDGTPYTVQPLTSIAIDPPHGRVVLQLSHTARNTYVTLVLAPSISLHDAHKKNDSPGRTVREQPPAHGQPTDDAGDATDDTTAVRSTVLTYLVNGTLVANHSMPGRVLHVEPRGAGVHGFTTNGSFAYHPLAVPSHTALRCDGPCQTDAY